jgi:heptosyltransferase-3
LTAFTQIKPDNPKKILVWHQGALGDLLLAGAALKAVSRQYPGAGFIGIGHPERWGLLAGTLPGLRVWDGGAAVWGGLFEEEGPLSPGLLERLAGVDLALVFSPRPRPGMLARLQTGGVGQAVWVPSFPAGGTAPVALLQARRLEELGIMAGVAPFRLRLPPVNERELGFAPGVPILALGPGSGSPAKNWPLAHYYEISRALAFEQGLQVVWLTGPAEEAVLPYINGIAAAQDQAVWAGLPLMRVAGLLSCTRLYLGGDSGITHLAAAAGARRVVALFGATDPRVWAPQGDRVTVLTPPSGAGEGAVLADLSPAAVLAALRRFL